MNGLNSGYRFIRGRLKKRAPLSIGLIMTHQCNLQCVYCGWSSVTCEEMDTDHWLRAIDEFLAAGTLRIGFSGGEPLLRKDLGELLARSHGQAMITLNTNGILLPERKNLLKHVDVVVLSLDGAQKVHDDMRGKEAFNRTIAGAQAARLAGKKVILMCVLTRKNLDQASCLLDLADELGATCAFHVVTPCDVGSDNAADFLPETQDFLQCIKYLKSAKKQGRPIYCSRSYLDMLSRYPDTSAPVNICSHCHTCFYDSECDKPSPLDDVP